MRKSMKLILMVVVFVSGCAEQPKVMRLTVPGDGVAPIIWPMSPDEPRYRYVGELTGENNFQFDSNANAGTASKFFGWLVGLSDQNEKPVLLQRPQAGIVDQEGRIYVTDVGRNAVFVFDKPAGELEVWEYASKEERMVAPVGLALGRQGEILLADAELHGIFRLNVKGEPIGEFGRDILKRPTGLARDPHRGIVYVADTHAHEIKVFDDDGNLLRVIGQRGEGDGELNFPTYLAFAGDRLHVVDTLNSRIQIFDVEGNTVARFGERGLFVGNMVRPKGVAVDSSGNIYVIESLHDRLLVYNKEGRFLLGIGGSGAGAGLFSLPAGVWLDGQDKVYIADMFNSRVVILEYLGSKQ